MFLILCLIPQWGLGSLLPLMGDMVPLSPMGGSRKVLDSRAGKAGLGGRARTGGGL